MNELSGGERAVYAAVKITADTMTDEELAAVNLAMQLDYDPTVVRGFEKAKHLFTEKQGKGAHALTKEAFARIVLSRLVPKEGATNQ